MSLRVLAYRTNVKYWLTITVFLRRPKSLSNYNLLNLNFDYFELFQKMVVSLYNCGFVRNQSRNPFTESLTSRGNTALITFEFRTISDWLVEKSGSR